MGEVQGGRRNNITYGFYSFYRKGTTRLICKCDIGSITLLLLCRYGRTALHLLCHNGATWNRPTGREVGRASLSMASAWLPARQHRHAFFNLTKTMCAQPPPRIQSPRTPPSSPRRIGSGLLTLPWATARVGLVLSLCALAAVAWLSQAAIRLTVRCACFTPQQRASLLSELRDTGELTRGRQRRSRELALERGVRLCDCIGANRRRHGRRRFWCDVRRLELTLRRRTTIVIQVYCTYYIGGTLYNGTALRLWVW